MKEFDSSKRLIEEMGLSLEKEQMEEAKAKQNSELAQLRSEEIKQRITDEVSVAKNSRLEVVKARHEAIVSELNSVKKVLETLRRGSISLGSKRSMAIRRAEEAVSLSKDVEEAVNVLTLELITARESLASVRAAHMEAAEHIIVLALATDQDAFICEEKLKQAEEEMRWLKENILVAEDLKSELDTASNMLLSLQSELTAYMIAKLYQDSGRIGDLKEKDGTTESKKTCMSIQPSNYLIKELEEVKIHTEEAKDRANFLKVASVSLEAELENKKVALASMKQREEMTFVVVSSLQAELHRTKSEIKLAELKENEARQKMVQLPKALQQAAQEADEAKSIVQLACKELQKAKEEVNHSKASAITIKGRLHAALKEIEALKASESLALAAVKALQESEQTANIDGSPGGVDLPLDEYYMLSNRTHDAEESADERAATALSQIEEAKESELRTLKKLQAMDRELAKRKEAARVATKKAEKAEESKLAAEQELRMRRSEHEQRMKEDGVVQAAANILSPKDFEQERAAALVVGSVPSSKIMQENDTDNAMSGSTMRKKKSLFPHLVMLFARKKALNH